MFYVIMNLERKILRSIQWYLHVLAWQQGRLDQRLLGKKPSLRKLLIKCLVSHWGNNNYSQAIFICGFHTDIQFHLKDFFINEDFIATVAWFFKTSVMTTSTVIHTHTYYLHRKKITKSSLQALTNQPFSDIHSRTSFYIIYSLTYFHIKIFVRAH